MKTNKQYRLLQNELYDRITQLNDQLKLYFGELSELREAYAQLLVKAYGPKDDSDMPRVDGVTEGGETALLAGPPFPFPFKITVDSNVPPGSFAIVSEREVVVHDTTTLQEIEEEIADRRGGYVGSRTYTVAQKRLEEKTGKPWYSGTDSDVTHNSVADGKHVDAHQLSPDAGMVGRSTPDVRR